jgi:hypothetical protein
MKLSSGHDVTGERSTCCINTIMTVVGSAKGEKILMPLNLLPQNFT